MKLSRRIRELRYAKGWGPDDLASRAKISRTALYQIESGKTEWPRAATLRRIARALGVTSEDLLQGIPAEPDPAAEAEHHPEPLPPYIADRAAWSSSPLAPESLELEWKFRVLLSSPLRDGIARIVEESFRLLPVEQAVEQD